MGFWNRLLRRSNPVVGRTRDWRDDGRPLELDLDTGRLCGVGCGDHVERLEFLGPAGGLPTELAYPKKGLLANVDPASDRLTGLTFFFGHDEERNSGRFPGEIVVDGRTWGVDRAMREAAWLDRFGAPWWRDEDADDDEDRDEDAEPGEVLLFYERGPAGGPLLEWQVEFGVDGGLVALFVGEPLLADAEQRRRYGIDKPWPPASAARR